MGPLWRWPLVITALATVVGLFAAAIYRLQFSTDILSSLPQNDPVLADARYVILHHPISNRVVVDVAQATGDRAVLREGAAWVEQRMEESGLFREVGFKHTAQLLPELMTSTVERLPILFTAEELARDVEPLLTREKVREGLSGLFSSLQQLEGLGQAGLISRDPLALRNLVLARLASLSPVNGARIEGGILLSADGRHVLITAEPLKSGMDTAFARRVTALMGEMSEALQKKYGKGSGLVLTSVGVYRAALDNEESAKRNVKKAVLLSTLAIALLLFFGFPRPLIGMLALLPAFAGTMTGLFVYSLLHRTISLLALGFGGAIVSFTVDYGIAYLLFLDRPYETRGLATTREVWSLGLLAMLTTAVSFAFLSLSGFPALMEIGQFAALGVLFTYVFVHAFFPLLFPVLPPARRSAYLPLQRFVNWLASSQGIGKTYAAAAFGLVMLFFAKPHFTVDLRSLNAVSKETLAAEETVRNLWGDIFGRIYLLVEGKDGRELQRKSDALSVLLEREAEAGRLSQAFVPSRVFPGGELARRNFADWQRFWRPARVADLRHTLMEEGRSLGFSPSAFSPFFATLERRDLPATDLPEQLARLLGVTVSPEGSSRVLVAALTPGKAYDGEDFSRRIAASGLARLFDPVLFSKRFGALLFDTFARMAFIVGLITVLTAFFYFVDWQLTLIGIAPTLFALVSSLGTLNILGQPLGIPTLMVSVVVIGMGTDYALYLVRAYQRYRRDDDPSLGLIRLSVFLSFATTFLGFGVLALSDNGMLRSAGLGLSLGIGYSFLGAVTIAPPLLKRIFAPEQAAPDAPVAGSRRHLRQVMARLRHREPYPRLFARFKITCDPMFPRLADFIREPEVIIDIGTGYGAPALWLLELYPRARLFGIEPDRRRARFAAELLQARGTVEVGRAPWVPDLPGEADTALLLDVIHHLSDDELALTLMRLKERLRPGGRVIVRATIPSGKRFPWKRGLEEARIGMRKGRSCFRSGEEIADFMAQAGFILTAREIGVPGDEEWWFVGEK